MFKEKEAVLRNSFSIVLAERGAGSMEHHDMMSHGAWFCATDRKRSVLSGYVTPLEENNILETLISISRGLL